MINRSLIRIKTVQILYSYLLTRTDFKLAPAPDAAESSRDNLFAYAVYQDLIALLLKLSGLSLGADSGSVFAVEPAIKKNKVGMSLRQDPAVGAMLAKTRRSTAKFDSIIPDLLSEIYQSAIYTDTKRRRKLDMADDVTFWKTVFETIIRRSKAVEREMRRNEAFTHVGFDRGIKMFIDTLSSFDDTRATYLKARADLDKSLSLAYSLYHSLLALPVVITAAQERRIENNKNKYIPTADDLNPNTRLVDNLLVAALRDNIQLQEYLDEHPEADPANWRDIDTLAGRLLDSILSSEQYREYIDKPAGDFATDADFWREMMRNIVIPSDELAEVLETQSVYWNDDMDIMSTFVLKTLRRSYAAPVREGEDADTDRDDTFDPGKITLLPKFMNKADENFGAELFEYVVKNRQTYREYIDAFIDTKQWDTERLAFMHIVILMTAIAEIINYPSIPVPVTLNEYIEIANDYSTARSGQFINGILYSIINKLNADGIINKQ